MCAADSLRRVSIDKHEVETLWTYVLVNRDNKESICHSIDMCAADVSHSFQALHNFLYEPLTTCSRGVEQNIVSFIGLFCKRDL